MRKINKLEIADKANGYSHVWASVNENSAALVKYKQVGPKKKSVNEKKILPLKNC